MALVKGTNSYATVEETDAYFADRLDIAAWNAADATQKAQSLVTATGILDNMSWAGTAVSESQPLAFPRVAEYFDPKAGAPVYLDGSTVPNRLIMATYELAHHLLNNDGLQDDTGSVKKITVGPIVLDNIEKPSMIPMNVTRMIKPLLLNAGSNAWWRAN